MENKPNLQEDIIDLGKLADIAIARKKEIAIIIAGCTILAAGVSFVLPKQYESTTLVQTRSAGKDITGAAAMASMMGINVGGSSSANSPTNYIELMRSRHVLEPIIDSLEWEDEKKKPTAEAFAKSNLDIKNTKQTNLITVTAKGRTPEEAQQISQGVVDNFLAMQTDMNQQTQSLLVKFLNKRIETAKKEADEAATKLAVYSKENKMYAPDEQAKLAIEQLNAYDKAIGDMEVAQKSAQATYDTATAKLNQQKAGAKNFHINDNTTVQSLRAQIVSKQVELVGLRENYTEEHPSIIQAMKQLESLNNALVNEVNAAVDSSAASLNAAYAELLKDQAVAEAQASAASASEDAIKAKKEEKEKKMDAFPEAVRQYIQLQSDSKLKQEVYLNLVKQCEQDKIQEAIESMDIQIIDAADLPDVDKPSAPKRFLIIVLGFAVSIVISILYIIFCLRKYVCDDKGNNSSVR
ncbi:MAG: GumC family protein [Selenomonas sp.]|uniref:GumC family protein n=1 Tax=Selenomonas sp. TaxID=2053611 RepID=UPI0025E05070|nr:GumC family protein [Selenomonas sp.]MCR5756876.1 GumC family protein [Selenomonas sp.]